ncbi:LicD family protein [Robiginitalea sediminis]|uniref:LicD family protein n=1 Tax=Robiginitalea sediminis TaxID=1982593 RepID=UPI000B4B9716|nr:LicD family protein [Robiginitalea sediminis]
MAYDITLEGKNLKEAHSLLQQVCGIAEQAGVTYWLEGGTLLGIRRENRLLPWDNDLDISMMSDQLGKLDTFLSLARGAGLRIRIRTFEAGNPPFTPGDIRMVKIRKRRFFGLLKGKVTLDIFVKYRQDDLAYWMIAGKTKSVPYNYYQKFRTVEFRGHSYSIPVDTEGYLTYRYGDWETPKKDWDTTTDDRALS